MTDWQKVPRAPYYVEVWKGPYQTSYRINYRKHGLSIRRNLDEHFADRPIKEIVAEADRLISEARFGKRSKPKSEVLSEELCDEVVELKRSKDPATYAQAETFFRLHIKPFLTSHCPFATELNATVWLAYKTQIRLQNPEVALFNHWKFFGQLCKHAFEKGIIPQKLKLAYSEAREDFRERGLVIPDEDFWKIVEAATPKHFGKRPEIMPKWRDRILIQRFTGMRPGEVRELRKDRYDPVSHTISLRKEDTKTRQARSFAVGSEAVLEILTRRLEHVSGPFFFPSETDPGKPMDKHLSGWKAAIQRAGVNPEYTPHDLRHSFLTQMFKTSINPALICYQAGLSLEEAQKTYLHFTAQDTQVIASVAMESLERKNPNG